MSIKVNPAYSPVFQSDIVATYEAKEWAIKPLGLRIERHLDEVGFHTHVIAPYKAVFEIRALPLLLSTHSHGPC